MRVAIRPRPCMRPWGSNTPAKPPLIMDEQHAARGMDMIEEAIGEVEKEFGS